MGLPTIFLTERRVGARSWRLFGLRTLFVAGLLIAMGTIWVSRVIGQDTSSLNAQADVARAYFFAILGVQITFAMLIVPAVAAGAIASDRAQGRLDHLGATSERCGSLHFKPPTGSLLH